MHDQENQVEDSSFFVRITQEQKAILSSLIASLPANVQKSYSEYLQSGVEDWIRKAGDNPKRLVCSTCLPINFESDIHTFLVNREPDNQKEVYRDIKINRNLSDKVQEVSKEMGRRWIFTDGEDKGKTFDLRGPYGLSSCLFSAAMHYLVISKFKDCGREILFEVDKRGGYLRPLDKLEFLYCNIKMKDHYHGTLWYRNITIDINAKKFNYGQNPTKVSVKDFERELEDQKIINRVCQAGNDCVSKAPDLDYSLEYS